LRTVSPVASSSRRGPFGERLDAHRGELTMGGSQLGAGVPAPVLAAQPFAVQEVALLATTALLASGHTPWYAIACLPVLFTAGMTLMDTTDGLFMNLAYGWAFFNSVRKVYYNLAITGLSVAICLFIGGIEVLSLHTQQIAAPGRSHGWWGFLSGVNLNTAGFVIVAMFIVTWLAAMLIWRYGHIEEKWTARLRPGTPGGMVREPPAAEGGEPLVTYSVCNNPGGA
jgi:High-affinity nickel-transport protein